MADLTATCRSRKSPFLTAAEANVAIYFNSEFGSDYDCETWGSYLYELKKAHRMTAEKLGLKTIAIATGAFAESARSPFFGVLSYFNAVT